jgi:predicted ABC-type ATPase
VRYLALRDFELHVERVKARADAGGHSGSEPILHRIYDASLMNLRRAVQEMDVVWVYDNTAIDASHPLVLEARNGEIRFLTDNPPYWLAKSLDLA